MDLDFRDADISAYLGPAKLYFGDGAASKLHNVLRDCGVRSGVRGERVLLVADRDVVRLELYEHLFTGDISGYAARGGSSGPFR